MSTSLRRKKLLLNIPLVLARTPPPRYTTSACPHLSPHSLECRCHVLRTSYHILLQAPCPKSCRRHLRLWAIKKTDHPLPRLLRALLTRIFLQHAFKTCRQSIHTSTSLSNLTDSKFGGLLLKAKHYLLSSSPPTNTSSASHPFFPQLPPSRDTPRTWHSSLPLTPGRPPSLTFPHSTSVAMQVTPPRHSTFPLVILFILSGRPSMKHS
jgi:hypothetical protein